MIWPFRKPKPQSARRRLNGATVQALVRVALEGKTLPAFEILSRRALA